MVSADKAAHIAALESALAAVREENERLRIALGRQQAETCRVVREGGVAVENMSLDGDVLNASLRARADDAGRVERATEAISRIFQPETGEVKVRDIARAVLAAADNEGGE